ncbi:MAG: ABC transporter ATP-binding protein [Proteobacteria bacterium]|nr:ABC transporter ATP-binding protein [Pseudomonadota bacterium]
MEKKVILKCRNLCKSFNAGGNVTKALRHVDLDVKEGELLMLVGPSGCGKTTLISIVAAILDHDEGLCEVFGRDLKMMNNREKTIFRGRNIGFVFQSYNLIPTLTVKENVAVPLIIAGVNRADALNKAAMELELVGLGDKFNSFPSQISGGQQQRVAIARALVHNPSLIVCDEPTSALDQETGNKVMEIFKEVALRDNRTLLIVTHDNRIFHFADRIVKMNDGQIENHNIAEIH